MSDIMGERATILERSISKCAKDHIITYSADGLSPKNVFEIVGLALGAIIRRYDDNLVKAGMKPGIFIEFVFSVSEGVIINYKEEKEKNDE